MALFLGVSLADKVPGFFRDRSVPNKWSLSLWKNHKARDQPERFVYIVAQCSRHGKPHAEIELQTKRLSSARITHETLISSVTLFLWPRGTILVRLRYTVLSVSVKASHLGLNEVQRITTHIEP